MRNLMAVPGFELWADLQRQVAANFAKAAMLPMIAFSSMAHAAAGPQPRQLERRMHEVGALLLRKARCPPEALGRAEGLLLIAALYLGATAAVQAMGFMTEYLTAIIAQGAPLDATWHGDSGMVVAMTHAHATADVPPSKRRTLIESISARPNARRAP